VQMNKKKPTMIWTALLLATVVVELLVIGLIVWLIFSGTLKQPEPLEPLAPLTQSENIAMGISMTIGALTGVLWRKVRSWSRGDRIRLILYVGAVSTVIVFPLLELSSANSLPKVVVLVIAAWFSAWFYPRFWDFLNEFDPRNKKKPSSDSSSD
jgi:hypothetical protein